jgi:hypothetical protein
MPSATLAPEIASKPLSFMQKLDPLVSVYRATDIPNTSTNTDQPRLIIIASWTDARDVHIAKYITKYQALYPTAQILLLKSTMSCMFRPSQIGPAMRIAASVVRASQTPVSSSVPSSPLLVHIFSNGGSSSIANLYEQFAATAGSGQDKQLPPHVTIYDSCPGLFRMSRAVAFVSVSLPPLQQLIATPLLYAFAAFWTLCMTINLLPNSLQEWYKSHNHDVGNEAEVRRVYVYSEEDTLIAWKDVEAHATEAKRKGFEVRLERFERSAHVAHVRRDERRYWQIVRRAVEG